jgi:hypothetical protein
MEITQQVATATALSNAVEVASGILRRLDGNDISSCQDGPRDIEQDVAVVLNSRFADGISAMASVAVKEARDVA